MKDYIAMTLIIILMCLFIFITGTFLNLYFTAIDLNNAMNFAAKRVEIDGGVNVNTTALLSNLLEGSRIDEDNLVVTGSPEHQEWGTDIYVSLVYNFDMLTLGTDGYEIITIPMKMVKVLSSEYRPE